MNYNKWFEIEGLKLVLVEESKYSHLNLVRAIEEYQEAGKTGIRVYSNLTEEENEKILTYFNQNNRNVIKTYNGYVENINEEDVYYTVLKY